MKQCCFTEERVLLKFRNFVFVHNNLNISFRNEVESISIITLSNNISFIRISQRFQSLRNHIFLLIAQRGQNL